MIYCNGKIIKSDKPSINKEEQIMIQIQAFLQGAVYAFCNLKGSEEFRLKDLVGKRNFFWQETPLIHLYEKYKNSNNLQDFPNAVNKAGYEAGCILYEVLKQDKRTFFIRKQDDSEYKGNVYKWDGKEVSPKD